MAFPSSYPLLDHMEEIFVVAEEQCPFGIKQNGNTLEVGKVQKYTLKCLNVAPSSHPALDATHVQCSESKTVGRRIGKVSECAHPRAWALASAGTLLSLPEQITCPS